MKYFANLFRKRYKITAGGYLNYPYVIKERYTILFFIHWWSTPTFAPPHFHPSYESAYNYLIEQNPNAIIENE